MKLLNSQEVQEKKKAQSEVDLYKFHKIKSSLEKDILKLRKFDDSFDLEKKKAIKEMAVFMKSMQIRKAELLSEINELEKQKERILEPLIQERLELMELGKSSEKSKIIDEKLEKLDKREQEINDKELKLADEERKLANDRKVLEEKKVALEAKVKRFNDFINNNK
jgi:hypothetical protein